MSRSLCFCATIALLLVSTASAGKSTGLPTVKDVKDAWIQLVDPLSCEETCLKTCCRNGGGQDCIDACGCKGKSCNGLIKVRLTA